MRHVGNWLPSYLKSVLSPSLPAPCGPIHLLFLFVDHFELAGKPPRLSQWMTRYPQLAARHLDSDGSPPKHSWFYALDLLREEELAEMSGLVQAGLGEVELHWHHAHETAASLRPKLVDGLQLFQKHGFMRPVQRSRAGCFAFIHGNWSLNNALGDRFCGVDNEIELLQEAGCYGDFTFPALYSFAQPNIINTIHYASLAKGTAGYFRGRRAEVGKPQSTGEFMIIQGPLTVNWRDWRFRWHPMVENGEIGNSRSHGDPLRIDAWVRQRIHVQNRPEWIFVKVFCHGGQDHEAVLGAETDRMFRYLEESYNDGSKFVLHYVTAREAFNIVKAAEDGLSGNPHRYRDYLIPHPLRRGSGETAPGNLWPKPQEVFDAP